MNESVTSPQPLLILSERDGPIATVILNRPAKLNALTVDAWRLLGETFTALSQDDGVRCIVLRGAGEKAFSPGNDIAEFRDLPLQFQAGARVRRNHATHDRSHRAVPAPGGRADPWHLRAAAAWRSPAWPTLRICGTSARFGVPIKNLGSVMSYSELAPLVRLVGPDAALAMLLEGTIFGADEALRLGW